MYSGSCSPNSQTTDDLINLSFRKSSPKTTIYSKIRNIRNSFSVNPLSHKIFFLSYLMVAKILRKPEDPLLLYKLILCHISAALGNKGYLSSRKKNTSIKVTAVLLRYTENGENIYRSTAIITPHLCFLLQTLSQRFLIKILLDSLLYSRQVSRTRSYPVFHSILSL